MRKRGGEGGLAVTRRDLLGAAVAMPVAAASRPYDIPSPSRPSDGIPLPQRGEGDWARAWAAVARAEAAMDAAERAQPGARSREEVFALEEVYGDRLSDFYDSVRRLLRTPAPDVAALAEKIALAVDHEVATLEGGEACMAALKADALRIAAAR